MVRLSFIRRLVKQQGAGYLKTTRREQTQSFSTDSSDLIGVNVNVLIDKSLRVYLKPYNPNKKAKLRILFSRNNFTVQQLRSEIERRFPGCKHIPYSLRYIIPDEMTMPRTFDGDNDLVEKLMQSNSSSSCMQLFVEGQPDMYTRESPVAELGPILEGMQNPLDSPAFTMLSFYVFRQVDRPDDMVPLLQCLWAPFKALGRVYVAEEGINAQMAVPSNVLEPFSRACECVPLLQGVSLNVDREIPTPDFYRDQPFRALHVRRREQIVADGLSAPLEWSAAGRELGPQEWEEAIARPDALVFDCRNGYESDIGVFKGATPLNTVRFQDSWRTLREALHGRDKDTPIMTYCTGGIRCVKINAFLEQELGFTNTSRLRGGIISYARERDSSKESAFKGTNYVFDDRMGEKITEDVLSSCETCGQPCDTFSNCRNNSCSVRFLQCPNCAFSYSGCCCEACRLEYGEAVRSANDPYLANDRSEVAKRKQRRRQQQKQHQRRAFSVLATPSHTSSVNMEEYCASKSSPEPPLLKSLREETANVFPEAAGMLSGHLQGRLLATLSHMISPESVLEIGTFTGYSALCLSEGLRPGGSLLTVESDSRAAEVAQRYFWKNSTSKQIDLVIGRGKDVLGEIQGSSDRVFNMAFIDADKRSCQEYLQLLMGENGGRKMLADGALVVIDNTLFKGLVLAEAQGKSCSASADSSPKSFRMRRLGKAMDEFNTFCATHPHLSPVLIPLRDGLTLCRYHACEIRK